MGFFDNAKIFMDNAADTLEKQLERRVKDMSDSELLNKYSNATSDRVKAVYERELRRRNLL